MKILLLGEFSSLHANLKDGLVELGHDVTIAANGDGFKQIPCDIDLGGRLSGKLGICDTVVRHVSALPYFKNYDVVQVINPLYFYFKSLPFVSGISLKYFEKLKKQNRKLFFLAAGDDAYFWRYGRSRLKYGPFDDALRYDYKKSRYYMEEDNVLEHNKKVVDISDGVVPVMYEYELSYADCNKRLNTIPLPINVGKIKYEPNVVGNKVVVFHGLNRYGFKGTRFVEEAFRSLAVKHPSSVELIIDGKMPLKEYLSLMTKTNIVIDQVHSHSLGMNGLYALAMGKIVLGGGEPESLLSLNMAGSPVVNITPDSQKIVGELEKLINNKKQFQEHGLWSRQFVVNNHSHIKIAKQYLDTWQD